VALRKRRCATIGRAVGMTPQGVQQALERLPNAPDTYWDSWEDTT
jgi:hypothetical protein